MNFPTSTHKQIRTLPNMKPYLKCEKKIYKVLAIKNILHGPKCESIFFGDAVGSANQINYNLYTH